MFLFYWTADHHGRIVTSQQSMMDSFLQRNYAAWKLNSMSYSMHTGRCISKEEPPQCISGIRIRVLLDVFWLRRVSSQYYLAWFSGLWCTSADILYYLIYDISYYYLCGIIIIIIIMITVLLDVEGDRYVKTGCWDSIHVVEALETADRSSATYKLTTTVMLHMGVDRPELGDTLLSGSLTRQVQYSTVYTYLPT